MLSRGGAPLWSVFGDRPPAFDSQNSGSSKVFSVHRSFPQKGSEGSTKKERVGLGGFQSCATQRIPFSLEPRLHLDIRYQALLELVRSLGLRIRDPQPSRPVTSYSLPSETTLSRTVPRPSPSLDPGLPGTHTPFPGGTVAARTESCKTHVGLPPRHVIRFPALEQAGIQPEHR